MSSTSSSGQKIFENSFLKNGIKMRFFFAYVRDTQHFKILAQIIQTCFDANKFFLTFEFKNINSDKLFLLSTLYGISELSIEHQYGKISLSNADCKFRYTMCDSRRRSKNTALTTRGLKIGSPSFFDTLILILDSSIWLTYIFKEKFLFSEINKPIRIREFISIFLVF